MGLFSRFFGKKQRNQDEGVIANRNQLHPLSLQVLFEHELPATGASLQQTPRTSPGWRPVVRCWSRSSSQRARSIASAPSGASRASGRF
jgi:hypothetical protein